MDNDTLPKPESLRERKKRQTRERITEVGLDLFLANGYAATTLDEIAAAAGIARRTFFYYFKSKDEILLAQLDGYVDALKRSVRGNASAGVPPLDIARDALLRFSGRFQSPHAIAIAKLMRGNEVLRVRGAGGYQRLEQALYEGLCELWPGPKRRDRLRIVAMASIAVLRFATDKWFQQDCKPSLEQDIREAFEHLKAEI
jgi:AcrR family transcriptional regulator